MQNFDARKEAREAEAVLLGAVGFLKTSLDFPDDMCHQMLSSVHISFAEGEGVREKFREGDAWPLSQT